MTILEEAERLTSTDREDQYGDPLQNWTRTARLMSAVLGREVTPSQAILCMIGVKLARLAHEMKRDSVVDIAGYARLLERIGVV